MQLAVMLTKSQIDWVRREGDRCGESYAEIVRRAVETARLEDAGAGVRVSLLPDPALPLPVYDER